MRVGVIILSNTNKVELYDATNLTISSLLATTRNEGVEFDVVVVGGAVRLRLADVKRLKHQKDITY